MISQGTHPSTDPGSSSHSCITSRAWGGFFIAETTQKMHYSDITPQRDVRGQLPTIISRAKYSKFLPLGQGSFLFPPKITVLCGPYSIDPGDKGEKSSKRTKPKLTGLQFRYFLYFASLKANYWNTNTKKMGHSTSVLHLCVFQTTRFLKSRLWVTLWPSADISLAHTISGSSRSLCA